MHYYTYFGLAPEIMFNPTQRAQLCPEFNCIKRWLPPASGDIIVKLIWAHHNEMCHNDVILFSFFTYLYSYFYLA